MTYMYIDYIDYQASTICSVQQTLITAWFVYEHIILVDSQYGSKSSIKRCYHHITIPFWKNFSVSYLELLLPNNSVSIKCACRPLCYGTSVYLRTTYIAYCRHSTHPRIPETLVAQIAKKSQLKRQCHSVLYCFHFYFRHHWSYIRNETRWF